MEQGNEGDEIILISLRQIDCNIPTEVSKIAQIQAEILVDIVSKALTLITEGDAKFPNVLPKNVASRHKLGTNMASKIKELGYTGDCGYNQLLYPEVKQTKNLLTWLVQRLPRTEEEKEEVLGSNELLNRRIMSSLEAWKGAPWLLHFACEGRPLVNINQTRSFSTTWGPNTASLYKQCGVKGVHAEHSILERHSLEMMRDAMKAAKLEQDLDGNNAEKKNLSSIVKLAVNTAIQNSNPSGNRFDKSSDFSSIDDKKYGDLLNKTFQEMIKTIGEEVDANSPTKSLEKGSRFSHAAEFSQESVVSIGDNSVNSMLSGKNFNALRADLANEDQASRQAMLESEERTREADLEAVRNEITGKQHELDDLERRLTNATAKIRQLESELTALTSEGEALENDIIIKKKTLEMLPSAAENISKLQTICASSASRLMQLAQEWETHRIPLINQYRSLKASKSSRRDRCKDMVEEMKRMREDMASMIQQLKEKQERSQFLADELKKLPRNINRAVYVKKILDITASINKQNEEIKRITSEVTTNQKSIQQTSNTLSRSDTITEELVFKAAQNQNDPAMVEVYRQLRALRGSFDSLVDTVSKIGALEKQTRDLETKIDQEQNRVSANNSDKLGVDLEEVLKDNQQLVQQIKALSRK